MGHFSSKHSPKLKEFEIKEFSTQSMLGSVEVQKLHRRFYRISGSEIDDGVIDFSEFCRSMRVSLDSPYAETLFRLFDINNDRVLNFREFLLGFSAFTKEPEEKHRVRSTSKLHNQIEGTFRMLEAPETGTISASHLSRVLDSAVKEVLNLSLGKKQVDLIVARTFNSVPHSAENSDFFIDEQQYSSLAVKNPAMFKWITLNTEHLPRK